MSLETALQENTNELKNLIAILQAGSVLNTVQSAQVTEPKPEEPVKEVKAKTVAKPKVEKPVPAPEPEPEYSEKDEFEDPEAEGSIPKLPEGKRDRAYYESHVMPHTSKLGKMELDKNQATLRRIVTEQFKSPKGGFQIPAEDWDALVYEVKKAIAELEAAASDIA